MKVFFYGLFMDREILIQKGITPSNPQKGQLNDYMLKIGNRASLIPSKNEKTYGIIMEVEEEDVIRLYTEKSVADYIPEKVTIVTGSNEYVIATCYNLPLELITGTNEGYARSLYDLTEKLSFPEEYLEHIKKNIS